MLRAFVDRVHRQPELVAVWTMLLLVGVAILVTYSRLPADQFYAVSGSGVDAGFGRFVVFLGFPVTLIAFAIVPIAYDLAARAGGKPVLAGIALLSIALGATIAIPGVLEDKDLDVKWSNAPAAIGAALAFLITVAALRGNGPRAPRWGAGDTVRVVVAVAVLLCAVPWIAAELGLYLPGHFFLTGQIRPFAGESGSGLGPAVHHGDHHGLSGVELALAALALSRVVPRLARTWRRPLTAIYVSLMLVYGLANALQDFWLEQVVKRGWTNHRVPSMLHPALSPAWGALVVAAAVAFAILFVRRPTSDADAIIAT